MYLSSLHSILIITTFFKKFSFLENIYCILLCCIYGFVCKFLKISFSFYFLKFLAKNFMKTI